MKDKKLCAVGFCCIDIYDNTGDWYATGNGIDWGIHLSRMGYPVSVVSVVGEDSYGENMKKTLAEEGFDITHLRTESGETSVTHMMLKNGVDRVHLETVDGVMETYAVNEEERQFVGEHYMLHTDLFGNVLSELAGWKKQGVKVLMDFSIYSADPEFKCEEIFPNVDYVFFSADGLKKDLKEWMKEIKAYGPTLVTATMGEEGSICYDGERFYEYGIETPEKVVNTVGAGDSYIAGFTSGILEECDIPECMRRGAALAAKVIGEFKPY